MMFQTPLTQMHAAIQLEAELAAEARRRMRMAQEEVMALGAMPGRSTLSDREWQKKKAKRKAQRRARARR